MNVSAKFLAVGACVAMASACATSSASRGPQARGFLRFEVEPATAEVEIDEQYSGIIAGWAEGVVPVAPGVRRVTLRADGYITQRFDIEVAAHEEVTFILKLEPVLELQDDEPTKPTVRERLQGAPI